MPTTVVGLSGKYIPVLGTSKHSLGLVEAAAQARAGLGGAFYRLELNTQYAPLRHDELAEGCADLLLRRDAGGLFDSPTDQARLILCGRPMEAILMDEARDRATAAEDRPLDLRAR